MSGSCAIFGDPCGGCAEDECCAPFEACMYACFPKDTAFCRVAQATFAAADTYSSYNERVFRWVMPFAAGLGGLAVAALLCLLLMAVAKRQSRPPTPASKVPRLPSHFNRSPPSPFAPVPNVPVPTTMPPVSSVASTHTQPAPPDVLLDAADAASLSAISAASGAAGEPEPTPPLTPHSAPLSPSPAPLETPSNDGLGLVSRLYEDGAGELKSCLPPPSDKVLLTSSPPRVDYSTHSLTCGCTMVLQDKTLAKLYGVTKTSAKYTCYCHHFALDGRHCVLSNLPATHARRCHGVMFADKSAAVFNLFGVGNLSFHCGKQHGGHTECTAANCPFESEGIHCPYSVPRHKK